MRKFIILGLMAATAIPGIASAQPGELRRDARDVREAQRDYRDAQRDLRDAQRYGDRRDVREAQRDVRDARREVREEWQDYRRTNRNAFRQRAYVAPVRNWRYRPVTVGHTLQPAFYGQRYWISDPFRYRLPRAAPGQRYVRYGNDVLLINARNGRVIRVFDGFFW